MAMSTLFEQREPRVPKVFISHSSKDRDFVEREIISLLRSHGIETWYSKDDIQTASQWQNSIAEGLDLFCHREGVVHCVNLVPCSTMNEGDRFHFTSDANTRYELHASG